MVANEQKICKHDSYVKNSKFNNGEITENNSYSDRQRRVQIFFVRIRLGIATALRELRRLYDKSLRQNATQGYIICTNITKNICNTLIILKKSEKDATIIIRRLGERSFERGRLMKINHKSWQYSGSKWLEGLLLLVILGIVIIMSLHAETRYTTILNQEVSMWSGSIDNLE